MTSAGIFHIQLSFVYNYVKLTENTIIADILELVEDESLPKVDLGKNNNY